VSLRKDETLIVGFARRAVADWLVDHEITAAVLDDRLEALDSFEQAYQLIVRFVARQVDSAGAQAFDHLSRDITACVAHEARAGLCDHWL